MTKYLKYVSLCLNYHDTSGKIINTYVLNHLFNVANIIQKDMESIFTQNEEFIYKAEIKAKFGIRSNIAWNRRRDALIKAGMFKVGRAWIMKRSDWNNYIDSLAKMAKEGPIIKRRNGTAA